MKGCSYCVKLQYKIMYYDIPKHLRVGTKIAAIIVIHFNLIQMICITTYTVYILLGRALVSHVIYKPQLLGVFNKYMTQVRGQRKFIYSRLHVCMGSYVYFTLSSFLLQSWISALIVNKTMETKYNTHNSIVKVSMVQSKNSYL